ncbi:MAG TPA: ABC transporter ATP-binding protein [bacterium]|jgi:ABC-2 type transport system ATP-binding protein|nr:ABC transporter ATP-binding protein [Dictyoglomota bacterium]HHV80685.1 ABC transporter ATP-binding protein [bacterium]HOK29843.1 ABC transporter ATP-binding protein [bacterium]HOL54918.1 ABC transporter ATP-binding protein [bacterium]HPC77597.1 ABC transporter ATP-binding protein [bacterium]
MSNFILEVEDLKRYYGQVKAIDGVNFKVKQGSVFTLLGPNGAGKTTTIEIIEGLRIPDSGKIRFLGKEVSKIGREEKAYIGVSLQETNLIPYLTVRETLDMFKNIFERSLDADEVLKMVSLEDKSSTYIKNLSGGQKQRLVIGLAMINDPLILFLDEPTTGLDPQARRNTWDILLDLKRNGKTIILTTHYMEEAEILSDWVCIMDLGKIIKEGDPHSLIRDLGKESLIEVELDVNSVMLEELNNSGLDPVYDERHKRLLLKTNDILSTIDLLLRLSRENALQIKDVTIRQPNLEDVFLSLTGKSLREE